MKKNYLSPEIEMMEVRSAFAICGGSPQDPNKDIDDGGGNTMFPGGGNAPRRKLF